METGIKLIALEREEQIEKHGRTVRDDVKFNNKGQLKDAAFRLLFSLCRHLDPPEGWNVKVWNKMKRKTVKEKLIIAGALIAAEIDRLNHKK